MGSGGIARIWLGRRACGGWRHWHVAQHHSQGIGGTGGARREPRGAGGATSSDHTADAIRQEVYDLVNNNLSSPDYHFFIADYQECPGSWEITFLVVGAFYGGVCGYGSFRKGLDYVYSDLKATFGAVSGIVARVHKQHRDRHALSRKIEPTLD